MTRITLRTLAVGVGTAYFCSTIFLVLNSPSLSEVGTAVGWYASALAQFAVAIVLVGIGLGLFKIRTYLINRLQPVARPRHNCRAEGELV
jgi:hypothetical protein